MHIMKRIFLPLTLLTLFLSASCNNDAEFSNPENSGNVMFNAKFGKATRATDFQFEVKDGISVFASYADSDIAGEYAQNVKYEFTGKQFETNADLKYPESGKDLKFQAIYPYSSAGYSDRSPKRRVRFSPERAAKRRSVPSGSAAPSPPPYG